ncbi:LysM peptidoglycan-binding domain-containing protein [Halalkalibacter nanhaiisediminis]|nr:LysM peptidoglycan-binding domain-containing protein [Halalkalibacter nanhaiisediminis]
MKSYTMKSGDTLWKIATANGTTIQAIIDKNGLKSSTIQPGQTLILP